MELPLTKLKQGETAIVVSIHSRSNNPNAHHHSNWLMKSNPSRKSRYRHFQKRLEDMGFTPGTPIKVIKSAPFQGPIELAVRGSRLALGRGMAERILVRVER